MSMKPRSELTAARHWRASHKTKTATKPIANKIVAAFNITVDQETRTSALVGQT